MAVLSDTQNLDAADAARLTKRGGRSLSVEDQEVFGVLLGAGETKRTPLVAIHGATANHRDLLLALSGSMIAGRAAFFVDRPGQGFSSRPQEGYRLEVQARLIREAVGKVGLERPLLVANSYGAAVALAYTLAFPEDVAGLLLLAPVSHPWPGGVTWYNELADRPVIGPVFARLVVPLLGPLLAKRLISDRLPADYYEAARVDLFFRPRAFRANAADLNRLKPQVADQCKRYGEIAVPLEILADPRDGVVYTSIHSEGLVRDVSGACLTTLPGAGHYLQHTRRDAVEEALNRLEERL